MLYTYTMQECIETLQNKINNLSIFVIPNNREYKCKLNRSMKLNIQDTFNKVLPADPLSDSTVRREVKNACFSHVKPTAPSAPSLLHVSTDMLNNLGLSEEDASSDFFKNIFSGTAILDGTAPYSMCYGGHQFGHWAGQLGDGRAINLAEVVHNDQRWALQLKGAGPTPYSRGADGFAVLRSSIREHLCSESMFHLGVPTTRSLSLMLTGDQVMRDVMYDGNSAYEPGAVVCRAAESFIRFGNFQIFASREDYDNLRVLADYTIKHFFPGITAGTKEGYVQFFKEVSNRTLKMVIDWQRVGFVHGVMNTDNMSILGLTIDYGPYGWLEGYDPKWTPNTTDRNQRRYRYGNQPTVALWNLFQLANALHPIIGEGKPLEEILEAYKADFSELFVDMMRKKLGLAIDNRGDVELIDGIVQLFALSETDMTIFFRLLSTVLKVDASANALERVHKSFYKPDELTDDIKNQWIKWFDKYIERLHDETISDVARMENMNRTNPKYVLRNYMAQLAIDAAESGDYGLIDELYTLLRNPYDDQPSQEKWFAKRPEWARHKIGSSMLSCSS